VALDEHKKPKAVPAIIAETEEEQKFYDSALRRRQLRLILAGKMKANDATELKALFTQQ
jgi:acyl-CoA hydrolase